MRSDNPIKSRRGREPRGAERHRDLQPTMSCSTEIACEAGEKADYTVLLIIRCIGLAECQSLAQQIYKCTL